MIMENAILCISLIIVTVASFLVGHVYGSSKAAEKIEKRALISEMKYMFLKELIG